MSSLRNGRARHLLPLVAILGFGCDLPGRPSPADRPAPANEVADFDVLYKTHCSGCHGANGRLGPAPPLNDPLFLAIVPESELLCVIREGRTVTPGRKSPMPAFSLGRGSPLSSAQAQAFAELEVATQVAPKQRSRLTDAQIQALAGGIKKHWGSPEPPADSVPPYVSPLGTSPREEVDGVRVFSRACAGCHGKEGTGVERDGKLHGKLNDPAFLALISDQQLRRLAITGRPDLGMPPYDGKQGRPADFQTLTSEEIDAVVALLAGWRQSGPAHGK